MSDLLSDELGLILLVIGAFGTLGMLFGGPVLTFFQGGQQIKQRLKTPTPVAVSSSAKPSKRTAFLEKIGRTFAGAESEEITKLRQRMIKAGFFSKSAPYWYVGGRFLALATPQAVLFILWPLVAPYAPQYGLMFGSVTLAIISFVGPSFYIDKRITKRQDEYRQGFPDMMDLLVACVEAGLSLDSGVTRVSEELVTRYPNLSDHLKIMTLELRAGRERQEAWRTFAERLGLDEARSLATMLRQSEELGTSIGETLRVFADDMREKRMLYAEEKALALPAKLVLPLIAFVFPSLLGVLMLPAVVRMIWVFEQQG